MTSVIWDIEKLASLRSVFLRKAISNLRSIEGATLRFGETGKGKKPNYQVVFPNGVINTYRGLNHKPFLQRGQFAEPNISKPFTRFDLDNALKKALVNGSA